MRSWALILCMCAAFASSVRAEPEAVLPRVLLAIYDSREESTPRYTQIPRFLEMPANHLGFDIHYHDVNAPLPEPDDSVRGIVVWFIRGGEVPDPETYLGWLEKALRWGKKLVVIENLGVGDAYRNKPQGMSRINRVLKAVGVQDANVWHSLTYRARVLYRDPDMVGFEREIERVIPPFPGISLTDRKAVAHLRIVAGGNSGDASDLVVTGPQGGYIAEGFAIFRLVEEDESKIRQWYANPFRFLSRALEADDLPKPDVTTLAGQRIFYSHIDGDGWNSISEITQYNKVRAISAEVIRKEILAAYPEFAFNVGIITAEMDRDCYGVASSEAVAREILAIPHVEPSSHTHSHPLFWRFFADYKPEKEMRLLERYPPLSRQQSSLMENITADSWRHGPRNGNGHAHGKDSKALGGNEESEEEILTKYYHTPRSYACAPFDLDQEISGSIRAINALAPSGKEVKLLQWSGDSSPFEQAIAKTREAGVLNMNGGDSRFDSEYPSYASLAPIGLKVGRERQIYSSNSNEYTYTNLWTDRFFGFRYLKATVKNTDTPVRVKPFNIYFHMYSGQKQASLNAVKENLDFARLEPVIPITASHYAAIAGGFYSAELIRLSERAWRVKNRGALQTIRFDNASLKAVDFPRSPGVIGQRYLQGSLYAALDPSVEEPVITLKDNLNNGVYPVEPVPYLLGSRWQIYRLLSVKKSLMFSAQGYGTGQMIWQMPKAGIYLIRCQRGREVLAEEKAATEEDGKLSFHLSCPAVEPVEVSIEPAA